jgi:hypothetical protein
VRSFPNYQTVSLRWTLAICPCDTPHTLATLQSPADFLRVAVGGRPAKSPLQNKGLVGSRVLRTLA